MFVNTTSQTRARECHGPERASLAANKHRVRVYILMRVARHNVNDQDSSARCMPKVNAHDTCRDIDTHTPASSLRIYLRSKTPWPRAQRAGEGLVRRCTHRQYLRASFWSHAGVCVCLRCLFIPCGTPLGKILVDINTAIDGGAAHVVCRRLLMRAMRRRCNP